MAEAGDDEPSVPKKNPTLQAFKDKVDAMNDDDDLQTLLDSTGDPEKRKIIRARLRVVRVKKRELREARLNAAEEAMIKSKLDMAEASKQSQLESYSMKYKASSYHKSEKVEMSSHESSNA